LNGNDLNEILNGYDPNELMKGYDPYDIGSLVEKTNSDRLVHLQSVDDLYWKVFKAMLHARAFELRKLESVGYDDEDVVGSIGEWLECFAIAQMVSRHLLDVAKVRESNGDPFYFEQIVDFILIYIVDPVLGPEHDRVSTEPLDEPFRILFDYRVAYPPVGPVSLAVDRLSDSDREFLYRNGCDIRNWSRSLQNPDTL
jgi:hypothetical protein